MTLTLTLTLERSHTTLTPQAIGAAASVAQEESVAEGESATGGAEAKGVEAKVAERNR